MQKKITFFIVLVTVVFLAVFYTDPEKKAKELYVKISNDFQSLTSAKSYFDAHNEYNKIQNNINKIFSDYSSTQIAVSLSSEQLKIAGKTINQLKAIGSLIEQYALAEKKPLICAYILATHKLDYTPNHFNRILEIVEIMTESGETKDALKILHSIVNDGSGINHPDVLLNAANQFVLAGDRDVAIKILNRLKTATFEIRNKEKTIQKRLAACYARAGQLSLALQVHDDLDNECLCSIVEVWNEKIKFLTVSDKKTFISYASKLPQETICDNCKRFLIRLLADQGQIEAALKELHFIKKPDDRVDSVLEVTKICIEKGNKIEAARVFGQVFDPLTLIESNLDRTKAKCAVIDMAIKLGQEDSAKSLLESIFLTSDMPADGIFLSHIGYLFCCFNNKEKAIEAFEMAKKYYKTAPSHPFVWEDIFQISEFLHKANDLESLNCLFTAFSSVPNSHYKAAEQASVAMIFFKFGDKEKAIQLLEAVIKNLGLQNTLGDSFYPYEGWYEVWENACVNGNKLGLTKICSEKLFIALNEINNKLDAGSASYISKDLALLAKIYIKAGIPFTTKETEVLRKILYTVMPITKLPHLINN